MLELVEGAIENYLTRVFQVLAVRNRTELGAELHQLLGVQTDVHPTRHVTPRPEGGHV